MRDVIGSAFAFPSRMDSPAVVERFLNRISTPPTHANEIAAGTGSAAVVVLAVAVTADISMEAASMSEVFDSVPEFIAAPPFDTDIATDWVTSFAMMILS